MSSMRQRPTRTQRAAHARRRGPSMMKKLALSALGMILLGLIASMGSWAAWTVSDSNSSNSFSTNTVLLADNQGGQGGSATTTGTALFNVANLEPGSAATTQCIGVDISGSATASSLTLTASLGGPGKRRYRDS